MRTTTLPAALLLLPAGIAGAATVSTQTVMMSSSVVIPDADLSGLLQTINPTFAAISWIDSVTVTLDTMGGWNGDLYAYLWHNGVATVLVNRPGRTQASPDGSAGARMSITFSDAAPTDVHLVAGDAVGSYQPSGRAVSPFTVLDTSLRSQSLSGFAGMNPSGPWRLFIADVSSGEVATLNSWSITVTGVPEPGGASLTLSALGLLAARRRRSRSA